MEEQTNASITNRMAGNEFTNKKVLAVKIIITQLSAY